MSISEPPKNKKKIKTDFECFFISTYDTEKNYIVLELHEHRKKKKKLYFNQLVLLFVCFPFSGRSNEVLKSWDTPEKRH